MNPESQSVKIANLNIGNIVEFYTVDFEPNAEKIECFNCGIIDIGFRCNGKARIKTVKGWHQWHSIEYPYKVIPVSSGRYEKAMPASTNQSATVKGISIE